MILQIAVLLPLAPSAGGSEVPGGDMDLPRSGDPFLKFWTTWPFFFSFAYPTHFLFIAYNSPLYQERHVANDFMRDLPRCQGYLVFTHDLTPTTYCAAITRPSLRQRAAALLYCLLLNFYLSCTLNFFDLVCFRLVPECTWSWLLLRSNWGVFTTGWLV